LGKVAADHSKITTVQGLLYFEVVSRVVAINGELAQG
jgi:hypothetical protein